MFLIFGVVVCEERLIRTFPAYQFFRLGRNANTLKAIQATSAEEPSQYMPDKGVPGTKDSSARASVMPPPALSAMTRRVSIGLSTGRKPQSPDPLPFASNH
jgi:hypothetical protein